MSRLVFFPVASMEYKTWKDMNGQPITFHARGTGTEAIGNIIAKREGIEFGERSYVPGSENRIIAMMNGQIKATIVDLANKNKLLEQGRRPIPRAARRRRAGQRRTRLRQRRTGSRTIARQANIIVEELLKLWREMKANPGIIETERAKRNLLADQPKEVLAEVVPFYTEATKEGVYAPLEKPADVAKADFLFYTEAGQLTGTGGRAEGRGLLGSRAARCRQEGIGWVTFSSSPYGKGSPFPVRARAREMHAPS